jgi:hypothetical protein
MKQKAYTNNMQSCKVCDKVLCVCATPAVVVFVTLKQYHIEHTLTLLVLHGTKNCTQAAAAATATAVAAHRFARRIYTKHCCCISPLLQLLLE